MSGLIQIPQRKQGDELRRVFLQTAIANFRVTKLPLEDPERVLTNRTNPCNRMIQSARPSIQRLARLRLPRNPVLDQVLFQMPVYLRIVVAPIGTDTGLVTIQQLAELLSVRYLGGGADDGTWNSIALRSRVCALQADGTTRI